MPIIRQPAEKRRATRCLVFSEMDRNEFGFSLLAKRETSCFREKERVWLSETSRRKRDFSPEEFSDYCLNARFECFTIGQRFSLYEIPSLKPFATLPLSKRIGTPTHISPTQPVQHLSRGRQKSISNCVKNLTRTISGACPTVERLWRWILNFKCENDEASIDVRRVISVRWSEAAASARWIIVRCNLWPGSSDF